MGNKIVILGTSDTKKDQVKFLIDKIIRRGHEAIFMDLAMGAPPQLQGEITPDEVAAAAGKRLKDLVVSKDRFLVTNIMCEGAQKKALELLSQDRMDGIVALGGATIALLASQVMAKLPFGMPKVIGTPAAIPAYSGRWFGTMDVVIMQVIMEIATMNNLLRNAISQVAGVIAGMVEEGDPYKSLKLPYPSIAVTELGFCDQCGKYVEQLLEEKGYYPYPFHAEGVSDRALDRLISKGYFDGVIEIVPAGLIEAHFKGNRAADMQRLDAACERGIPQVWAPCCLNITGAGPNRPNREKYLASGKVLKIDEMRYLARFPRDELCAGARLYADKVNKARGPIKLVVPLRGWSSLDQEGSVLYDPAEDRIFVDEMKRNLIRPIEIEEVDCNLEEIGTARALVDAMDQLVRGNR